jgi:hypothetical protein
MQLVFSKDKKALQFMKQGTVKLTRIWQTVLCLKILLISDAVSDWVDLLDKMWFS